MPLKKAKPSGRRAGSASVEWIAFYLVGGVLLGAACGLGLDYLLHTIPLFLILGIFGGFAAGLYGIYKTVL